MKILKKTFLDYLKYTAKIQLWKMKPTHVVGITGSAGKSSCREAVYAILKDKYKVKAGHKSLNTEIGLPTDIVSLATSRYSFGVSPISSVVIQEQQKIADVFADLKLIPKRISVQQAVLQ